MLSYVLITPARNEAEFIGKTIESVIWQTLLPKRWVIVSDGSTDGTDDVVKKYLGEHKFISLIRMPDHPDRQFASKVNCFNNGYQQLKNETYDIIGNLDADITFGPDYFEFLLEKFVRNPKLGVAGTPFVENEVHYDYRFTNIEHVSGACQLFRRECFEEIGGYVPIKGGGIDWVAVTTARMKGWKTRTFTEKICFHHRTIGTGSVSKIRGVFHHGQKDYYLGGHPLWELFRGVYQMSRRPYILSGLMILLGFFWAMFRRVKRPVSDELIQFHRAEQIRRLRRRILKHEK
ncbi:MAG: glycosyltransferase family 2 protein [Deltaproteobacteria bacterium]|nr:glycosyltransferase family 2 protein [Deltaproteobacteria bacterium]